MAVKDLNELFLHELKDLYDAEKRILKTLPKLAKAASHEGLREAFQEHRSQTEQQVQRLEEVFELLGKPARGKKCLGMEGLLAEGAEIMEEDAEPAVMDAALIASAQKVEHYEICAYGTLVSFAKVLGLDEAVELLETTLSEEKETDKLLTQIATNEINLEAESGESEDEEEDAPVARGRR